MIGLGKVSTVSWYFLSHLSKSNTISDRHFPMNCSIISV